jgi:hypothetical protein
VTITRKSAKQKGHRLQDYVRDRLRLEFPDLESDDVTCAIGSQNGTDIKLSPAARKQIPYSIECKNQESISIWACLAQAEANTLPNTQPALIFKRNRTNTYVVIDFEEFIKLIK